MLTIVTDTQSICSLYPPLIDRYRSFEDMEKSRLPDTILTQDTDTLTLTKLMREVRQNYFLMLISF